MSEIETPFSAETPLPASPPSLPDRVSVLSRLPWLLALEALVLVIICYPLYL